MKKIIMLVAAAIIFVAPATMAQKINADAITAKLEKSDEAIANPKKAEKAATWITRGNSYLEALLAPTKDLFTSMDPAMIKLACGEPLSTSTEVAGGAEYQTLIYEYFTVYTVGSKVAGWKVTKDINPEAGDIALEAYNNAFELDPKQVEKIRKGLDQIINYYAQAGDISNILADHKIGAEAYENVYNVQCSPVINEGNPMMLYYAGYLYTMGAVTNPALYANGAEVLAKAVEVGYPEMELQNTEVADSDKGNIYYYLYHCYYGQKEADAVNIQKAKDALVKGIETFPKNQRIIDALTQLYTIEEGMGDPSELIALIDNAIASDPSNADLWFARGRVFFALKDYDNCIASFTHVTEHAPEVFDGHFYLGLFYIYKGDALNDEINEKIYTDNSEYAADMNAINDIYAAAIPILERAYELKPTDIGAAEYLKSLCFRLRDEEGVMDKYNKYNDIYNTLKAQEEE